MTCCFFGHRDFPDYLCDNLKSTIKHLIEKENADLFYVGNNGNFDRCARRLLRKLKEEYPYISYYVVLAYLPNKKTEYSEGETIFPEGLESVPPKFAINKRNLWMIEKSDYVVAFVEYSIGGAARAVKIAESKGKKIIHIKQQKNTDT